MKSLAFIFLFLFSFPSFGILNDLIRIKSTFNDELLKEIYTISERVRDTCASKCFVIGVGRSPNMITHYLEEFYKGSSLDLPLSSFRYLPHGSQSVDDIFFPLTQIEEERLFKYFDKFLKGKIPKGTTKISLLDYSQSGTSLFSTQKVLDKYFQKKGIKVSLEAIAMVPDSVSSIDQVGSYARKFGVENPKYIYLKEGSVFEKRLRSSNFDDFSSYGKFDIIDNPEISKTGPIKNKSILRKFFTTYFKKKKKAFRAFQREGCFDILRGLLSI